LLFIIRWRVQKFDNNGNFFCRIGAAGSASDSVGEPAEIAVDESGNIYVVDRRNHQVKTYAPIN
jgi:DNA-binding beta-propeller fold protein YncE